MRRSIHEIILGSYDVCKELNALNELFFNEKIIPIFAKQATLESEKIMFWLISKIANAMQFIYIGWNCLWWNHHMSLARHHEGRGIWHSYWFGYYISRARVCDYRISKLDADWRKNLEEN